MTGKWKVLADYYSVASERGFRCLVTVLPETTRVPVEWECPFGHTWKANYNTIQRGEGCPTCSGNKRKEASDYNLLARQRSICWIGEFLPLNCQTKTRWRCSKQHEWEATYHNINTRGSGCPYCSHCVPLTAGDYADLSRKRGFIWCGEFPKHTLLTTMWQCQKGHTWKATYNTISKGEGCPHCLDMVNGSQVSKVQRRLHKLLGGELNSPVGRYRVDIALDIEGIRIGVEYDAHVWHHGREAREAKRDAFLIAQGWRMLHIRTKAEFPTRQQLDAAIAKLISGASYIEIVMPDWGS